MTVPPDVFRPLDPPPGGLALLRERLARRRRTRAWSLGLPAAAAACVALVLALRPAAPNPVRAQLLSDPLAQSLGLLPARSEVATGEGSTALRPAASANPLVAIYWVDGMGEAR